MSNKKRFEVTVTAATWGAGTREYPRGYQMVFDEDDPRLNDFRDGSGKWARAVSVKVIKPTEPLVLAEAQTKPPAGVPLSDIDDSELIEIFKAGGYETCEQILAVQEQDLLMVRNVGKARAKTIRKLAKKAIAEAAKKLQLEEQTDGEGSGDGEGDAAGSEGDGAGEGDGEGSGDGSDSEDK